MSSTYPLEVENILQISGLSRFELDDIIFLTRRLLCPNEHQESLVALETLDRETFKRRLRLAFMVIKRAINHTKITYERSLPAPAPEPPQRLRTQITSLVRPANLSDLIQNEFGDLTNRELPTSTCRHNHYKLVYMYLCNLKANILNEMNQTARSIDCTQRYWPIILILDDQPLSSSTRCACETLGVARNMRILFGCTEFGLLDRFFLQGLARLIHQCESLGRSECVNPLIQSARQLRREFAPFNCISLESEQMLKVIDLVDFWRNGVEEPWLINSRINFYRRMSIRSPDNVEGTVVLARVAQLYMESLNFVVSRHYLLAAFHVMQEESLEIVQAINVVVQYCSLLLELCGQGNAPNGMPKHVNLMTMSLSAAQLDISSQTGGKIEEYHLNLLPSGELQNYEQANNALLIGNFMAEKLYAILDEACEGEQEIIIHTKQLQVLMFQNLLVYINRTEERNHYVNRLNSLNQQIDLLERSIAAANLHDRTSSQETVEANENEETGEMEENQENQENVAPD